MCHMHRGLACTQSKVRIGVKQQKVLIAATNTTVHDRKTNYTTSNIFKQLQKQQHPRENIRIRTSGDKSDGEDFFITMQHNLHKALRSRVTFRTSISYDPVQDAVADAKTELGQNPGNGGDLIMLGRSAELAESQASSCLDLVADVMLERDVKASIVVEQARKE
jgi:hypothetical protein